MNSKCCDLYLRFTFICSDASNANVRRQVKGKKRKKNLKEKCIYVRDIYCTFIFPFFVLFIKEKMYVKKSPPGQEKNK